MKCYIISLLAFFALRACEEEKPADRTIVGVKTSVAAFVDFFPEGPANSPTLIRSTAELEKQFGMLTSANEPGYNVRQIFLNGGSEVWIVRVVGSNNPATIIGDSVTGTGMHALDRVDLINLVCLPRVSDSSQASRLIEAGGAYCENRRAILIADVPKNLNIINGITEWASSFAGKRNVAMYYPGVQTPEQPGGMSCTGTIAGIIARVDTQYGIWKAPAGPDAWLGNVTGFEHEPSPQEALDLSEAGVNPLRTVRGNTRLVWGARLLSDDPEWKYLTVRRLALYIEESVQRGTRWAAFEPNGDPLWAQVRLHVNNFMHTLFTRGALVGSKPSEAYYVSCDRQTTTQEDVDNNMFTIRIGFAALKTAEFQIVTVRQHARPSH